MAIWLGSNISNLNPRYPLAWVFTDELTSIKYSVRPWRRMVLGLSGTVDEWKKVSTKSVGRLKSSRPTPPSPTLLLMVALTPGAIETPSKKRCRWKNEAAATLARSNSRITMPCNLLIQQLVCVNLKPGLVISSAPPFAPISLIVPLSTESSVEALAPVQKNGKRHRIQYIFHDKSP